MGLTTRLLTAFFPILAWALSVQVSDWKPTRIVAMDYPPVAAAARVGGSVTIKCLLDGTGRVVTTERIDPVTAKPDLLGEAAQNNARQWIFSVPTGQNSVILRYSFEFENYDSSILSHSRFIYDAPDSVRVIARIPLTEIQITYPSNARGKQD